MMDKIKSNARDLRRNLTLQERKLWRYLRSRRFGDFKFRRQHPVGSYILDFACCSARVVVELDGGQHDLAVAYDTRRTSWLESQGWTADHPHPERARGPTEPNSCCGENMETVLENIRQGLNHPSHRHKRVRGCMSLFVAGVTIFAQYGPLAPLGRGLV
ncbi:TPA: DUF559 domain-containing protein [Shigella dysenteriae]|nr:MULTISPECIES: DUF559 domain-containing protein [Shigella]EFY9895753.1 DUF559 domain-containing protein [Shigella dysenteriae]MJQ31648.1 DUF559 domain-containing protein [Shigella dysenteriae]ODQ06801.1 hypothetical protein BGK49_09765 [Shigella sp. FC1544]OOO88192.1 hypothetical protein AJR19_017360 [Shigella dysenteriae]